MLFPPYAAFGNESLLSGFKLVRQWPTVQILDRPVEVLKCLKFPPLNLVQWTCTDEFLATITEGVVHIVTSSTSTHLLSSCYTKRWPSHNLKYALDHTFSYRSNPSAPVHGKTVSVGSLNILQLSSNTQGIGCFATVS